MSDAHNLATVERKPVELFISASGRTAFLANPAGLERIAEEHEWMRDRIAHLELKNALLRSVVDGLQPVVCREPATV